VLRWLIAGYLEITPEQIVFRDEAAGKPALAIEGTPLAFNMSHSGDLEVYAFARDCRLGIYVEHIRPMPDLEAVASRFFSLEERSEILALDAVDRPARSKPAAW
jgi:4'-phosphopantetheinyl transferase